MCRSLVVQLAMLFIPLYWAGILLAEDAPTDSQAAESSETADESTDEADDEVALSDTQGDADADTPVADPNDPVEEWRPPPKRMGPPKGAKRLSPKDDVWIHQERKVVLVDGRVSLRDGMLEMFACPRGTKEHESVIAVDARAFLIHAALLNLGAEPGHPVRFSPEYQPAAGTEIEIQVLWIDEADKRHSARAQDWVLDAQKKKAMEHWWVFAGSGFWKDELSGKRHYQAEAGDLICVSNFSSAMLDLPVESSQSNEGLVFEAFTKHIPPLGTHVRLVLIPVLEKPPGNAEDSK